MAYINVQWRCATSDYCSALATTGVGPYKKRVLFVFFTPLFFLHIKQKKQKKRLDGIVQKVYVSARLFHCTTAALRCHNVIMTATRATKSTHRQQKPQSTSTTVLDEILYIIIIIHYV
jgi:hypothetical protein